MNPEIYIVETSAQFDSPPNGKLLLKIAAKSKSGKTERVVEFVFNGSGKTPKLKDIK